MTPTYPQKVQAFVVAARKCSAVASLRVHRLVSRRPVHTVFAGELSASVAPLVVTHIRDDLRYIEPGQHSYRLEAVAESEEVILHDLIRIHGGSLEMVDPVKQLQAAIRQLQREVDRRDVHIEALATQLYQERQRLEVFNFLAHLVAGLIPLMSLSAEHSFVLSQLNRAVAMRKPLTKEFALLFAMSRVPTRLVS